eukprot:scaffold21210_cov23-Tisochrysis_lutea.AAC.1
MESTGFPGSVQISTDTYLAALKQMNALSFEGSVEGPGDEGRSSTKKRWVHLRGDDFVPIAWAFHKLTRLETKD